MSIYEDFCRSEAARRGIDPDTAVKVANSEGGLTEPARRGTFPTGSSWWAFQLHYGGSGYEHFGTVAGLGNDFTRITGWQPGDPNAWRDAMRFALDEVRRSGWGKWYGAKKHGITGFMGVNRSVPWAKTPDNEWDYKRGDKPMVSYTFPVVGFRGYVPTHWESAPDNGHRGASDLFAARGTAVVAMVGGLIDGAGSAPISGNYVSMKGDDGLDYWLAHLNEWPTVRAGQRVKTGDRLGSVGDSGNAAGKGTHLHIGGGYGIAEGSGPAGGAGLNYDFVGLLRRILAGQAGPPLGEDVNQLKGIIRELEAQLADERRQKDGLVHALAHVADVVIADAAAEAARIRREFLGDKP